MAKEKKEELAVGLQLSETYAELSYYSQSMKEPVTSGTENSKEPKLFDIPAVAAGLTDGQLSAAGFDAAKQFLKEIISQIPGFLSFENLRIMITVPKLKDGMEMLLPSLLESLGVERKNIYLQDYLSSFFYYTVNQKKELWNGDVALLEYQKPYMIGYVLRIDHTKTPALASASEVARVEVNEALREGRSDDEWNKEKDRLLFELLKRIFERRNVVTSYLLGDYFEGKWPVRSFQYLCFHRHAFRGGNLYTQGAVFAAGIRAGMLRGQDIIFLGNDMIRENLGMYVRVRGREMFYPVISAGVNWYEAHHECEFIPEDETTVTLITKPMAGGEEVAHILRLHHFPKRPPRATRLRMNVYFTDAKHCVVEVEDMGFGGFFRPDGKTWKRTIVFY